MDVKKKNHMKEDIFLILYEIIVIIMRYITFILLDKWFFFFVFLPCSPLCCFTCFDFWVFTSTSTPSSDKTQLGASVSQSGWPPTLCLKSGLLGFTCKENKKVIHFTNKIMQTTQSHEERGPHRSTALTITVIPPLFRIIKKLSPRINFRVLASLHISWKMS